jgi:hypothetical protein
MPTAGKGDRQMLKTTVRYVRYALSALGAVGFGIQLN